MMSVRNVVDAFGSGSLGHFDLSAASCVKVVVVVAGSFRVCC